MMLSTQNKVAGSRIMTLGVLLAAIMVAFMLLAAGRARASTTFTVTNTDNSGVGSLRQAILDANATSGADTINFNIPTTGVATISPTSELPQITEAVTINGYSQPGASPNTKAVGSDAVLKIELNGASAGPAHGLLINASNSTIKGLVINRYGEGIRISGSGATGNKVVGNYLGTDASGTKDLGNGDYGVAIGDAPNNTIGGTTAGARNVISGNLSGLGIDGANATGNKVTGNYIGTARNGTAPLGNSSDGVFIHDAPNNTVGGATTGERNVISANNGDGVSIEGTGASGNKILGNYVGTDASGTRDLGNSVSGVSIYFAPDNTVGGTTVGERNVISGNEACGVAIENTTASGNKVVGNYIGTDKYGTGALGNSVYGVIVYDAPDNAIGGTQAGERNVISGSGSDGVHIEGGSATGNRILSNSIFNNGELGIDLVGTDGPTANDTGDADVGANNLQNKPVLSSARKSATGRTVAKGTLNSTPNTTFLVQFFSNPTGTNEGKKLLGQQTLSTDGAGNLSFTFSTTKSIKLGQNITATATGVDGTSEFSAPRKVVAQ